VTRCWWTRRPGEGPTAEEVERNEETRSRAAALPTAPPAALGLSRAGLDRLEATLEAFVDSGQVGGIYAVIERGGMVGWERTYGWRDVQARDRLERDDIFHIYSMTKPVVAVGLLILVDDGVVDLDDPVSRWIPAFADVRVFAGGTADDPVLEAAPSPTVRQLLNHTAGLPYGLTRGPADSIFARARLYHAARPLPEFADSLATMPLLFRPGTAWSYGSGLDVAGRIIEVASGRSLDEFLRERLFEPLGMEDTGFRVRPGTRDRVVTPYERGDDGRLQTLAGDGLMAMFEPGARFLWGSGGILSTPDDFLRFARMLANGGELEGVRILRRATVARMTRNTLPPELTPVSYGALPDSTYGFGLGVAVKVDSAGSALPAPVGTFRWSGYLGTYFWVDPVHDLVAMVWTQHSPGRLYPIEHRFQEGVYAALEPRPAVGALRRPRVGRAHAPEGARR
jgi:CubicO group peptidase (beta-lactamase class C family)